MTTPKCFVTLILACGLFVAPSTAQRDFSAVEMKATQVSGSVYMLEGSGGNIGVLVGKEGTLIVDDQFAPLAPKIEAALANLTESKLKYVLNTHHHGDHTGGNGHFGQHATIIAHQNVRARLRGNADTPASALPVITFAHASAIHFNGEKITLVHRGPGHTDGDSVVRFTNANVVHMGDLFFSGRFPYVDLGSGGDIDGYMAAVGAVVSRVDDRTKIIPGHGGLATKKDLVAYHDMIRATVKLVRAALRAGKTPAEIEADGLLSDWASWGEGWITTRRWIETIDMDMNK